jgi:hypothetical protein
MKIWFAPVRLTRRALMSSLLAGGASLLQGCGWDGHLNFLGYTTKPNIPDNIRTVYLPIFKNKVLQAGPFRGMEFPLTRAVITAVEMKGYKVISDPNNADTELLGTIIALNKNLLNRTEQNEVREGQIVIGVELVWRDLRSGVVLTNPPKPAGTPPVTDLPPFDPNNLPRPESLEKPIPVMVTASGRFLPEVGESTLTAQSQAIKFLAQAIADKMEKDWCLPPKPIPAPQMIPPGQP